MAEEFGQKFEERVVAAATLAVYKFSAEVAGLGSEDYAPKGHTLQLSRGIRALPPLVSKDGIITGRIISSARSRSGYDYAEKQHNISLRHFSEQPLRQGFVDVGEGSTRRARYNDGRIKLLGSSPVYAAEYLTKPYEVLREAGVRVVEKAVRDA